MNLALFDFDGTITNEDMYTKFLYYSATRYRAILAKFIIPPFFLLYKLGILSAPQMRSVASYLAFCGRKTQPVKNLGKKYASEVIPKFIREEALKKLKWHIKNGDRIVIVSASLDVYLKEWCKKQGFSLICTELEIINNKYSGRYSYGDCSYQNKPKSISSNINLTEYGRIYAYGDTHEDIPMLNMANEAYLNWEQYSVDTML